MKTLLSIITIFFITISANAQEFKFEKETIDYGTIAKGSKKERTFTFTNIGDAPLVITKVQSSCGCTIPKKPEKPVMPGEKGEIKVSYDTNRVGRFSKRITITSNAKTPIKIVQIKGTIKQGVQLEKEKSTVSL